MDIHAAILKNVAWRQHVPSWRDFAAMALVLTAIILVGLGARQMVSPIAVTQQSHI